MIPAWLRMLACRLRGLFRNSEARLEEEIEEHMALAADDLEGRGMTPEAARAEARRRFGAVTQIRERYREQQRLPFAETFARDLRYAARQLRVSPGFTTAAVLTLALGIGANTAIFQVMYAVVLRLLPVRAPEQLVVLAGYHNGKPMTFSYPLFQEMAKRQQVVEGMFATCDFPVAAAGPMVDVHGRLVTGGYFRILGVNARLGRVLTDEDDRPSAAPVAVISDRLWRLAFGGGADVLGRAVPVNQASVTIAGVMPPEFFGEKVGSAPDVWVPMSISARVWSDLDSRGLAVLRPMARLRSDVPVARAQAALNLLYNQLTDFSMQAEGTKSFRLALEPGSQGLRELQEQFSAPLKVLMAIAGLVLLMACSNLANLLLARAASRTHEIGVRLALGAARTRLVRQLLTESLALAAMGGACGIAIALWGSHRLVEMASAGNRWRISMDSGWRAPVFTMAITAAALCLFGLAPALAATRLDLHAALLNCRFGRSGGGRAAKFLPARWWFVVAQVALSLLLVSGAALLVRSFWNLYHEDLGYRREGALLVEMKLDFTNFKAAREIPVQAVFDRLNTIPGVQEAALVGLGPFSGWRSGARAALPGRPSVDSEDIRAVAVSPRFFEAMGIPILAGRAIAEQDRAASENVAVISETAARTLFGGVNPVGAVFTNGKQFQASGAIRIVGVAHDIRFAGPRDPFGMVVYRPLAQERFPVNSIVLRTLGDPALFAERVRQAISEVLPSQKPAAIRTLRDEIDSQLGQERMLALLSGAFGLLALVLASVGIYGVTAYGVERRSQEIGIRLALGARRGQVYALLLREILAVLAIGLAVGGAATAALGKWVRAVLFGLSPHDAATLGCAALLLSVVAVAAGCLPARRAAHLDPVSTLRQE